MFPFFLVGGLLVCGLFHFMHTKTHSPMCQYGEANVDLPEALDLLTATIDDLGKWLNNGSLSSTQLVEAYLGEPILLVAFTTATSVSFMTLTNASIVNIERDNSAGVDLRAIIQTAPRAQRWFYAQEGKSVALKRQSSVISIANQLDIERSLNKTRGPMHGIPLIIKSVSVG